MKLTPSQFQTLHSFAFSPRNSGYKPSIQESPNGDGTWDTGKRFAHVASKYGLGECFSAYKTSLAEAIDACHYLGIPGDFWPVSAGDSTLRVLDYPAGATSAPHTDFDLFTVSMYRPNPEAFRYLGGDCAELNVVKRHFPGIHFGELITEIMGWPATEHEVIASPVATSSAVFFAMPPLDARLPSGVLVGEWLRERKERSRREVEEVR